MECSKKVNGECGKALNCVWCPERFTIVKRNFSIEGFRRKKVIKNHRKMWNWIADNQEEMGIYDDGMKSKYLSLYEKRKPLKECYLCDYVGRRHLDCSYCLIDWGNSSRQPCLDYNDKEGYDKGLFSRWVQETDLHEAAKLAREIANLPEKVIK